MKRILLVTAVLLAGCTEPNDVRSDESSEPKVIRVERSDVRVTVDSARGIACYQTSAGTPLGCAAIWRDSL